MELGFIVVLLFIFFLFLSRSWIKRIKKDVSNIEFTGFIVYIISIVLFAVGLMFHQAQYYQAVDPVDGNCYIPFGDRHIITLLFYFLTFNISMLLLWIKGNKLPPIVLVSCLIFLFIGFIVNIVVILQIVIHNTKTVSIYIGNDGTGWFIFTPIIAMFFSIILLLKIITAEKNDQLGKVYSNKILNFCNQLLLSKFTLPLWALILFIPAFLISTIILILFGQDYNSIVKVFTETTTWTFSQKAHPPILDHRGHYLCTVAAKGNPNIVKPIYLGTRNGNTIIVNRQLQIANAFEEMIQDFSPKIHRFIRHNYDKYGYNLSLKINTEKGSNITYLLMKPLEYFFLISLYVGCKNPEKKINKQYRNQSDIK